MRECSIGAKIRSTAARGRCCTSAISRELFPPRAAVRIFAVRSRNSRSCSLGALRRTVVSFLLTTQIVSAAIRDCRFPRSIPVPLPGRQPVVHAVEKVALHYVLGQAKALDQDRTVDAI